MYFYPSIWAVVLFALGASSQESATGLQAVSRSADDFATSFFKVTAGASGGKNLVSSALSAHVVLSMAAYGARGNTAAQMRSSLSLPADDDIALKGFQNLLDYLRGAKKVTLELANKIFVAGNLKVKDAFKQLTSETFRSETAELDVSNTKAAVKSINDWVAERTHQKIRDILSDGDVTSDTRMALLNAIYFKGNWAKPFRKIDTRNKTFHLSEKNELTVPMMHRKGSYIYGELPDLKAKFIEIPYENKEIKMVIIVPNEVNGLNKVEENLESFNCTRLVQSGSPNEVDLHMPKFKIESTIDLEQSLQQLGMTDMFTDLANFSGISDEPLKVDKVRQKAFIEVNEEGSEAAAATVLTIQKKMARFPKSDPIVFVVDRPFYYQIRTSEVKLFEGHVYNPTA